MGVAQVQRRQCVRRRLRTSLGRGAQASPPAGPNSASSGGALGGPQTLDSPSRNRCRRGGGGDGASIRTLARREDVPARCTLYLLRHRWFAPRQPRLPSLVLEMANIADIPTPTGKGSMPSRGKFQAINTSYSRPWASMYQYSTVHLYGVLRTITKYSTQVILTYKYLYQVQLPNTDPSLQADQKPTFPPPPFPHPSLPLPLAVEPLPGEPLPGDPKGLHRQSMVSRANHAGNVNCRRPDGEPIPFGLCLKREHQQRRTPAGHSHL
ncbi:hypothetical protein RJ55_08254 [Drechmeria coniospora]|nr:hypothetical protein RJ55_08254 [Drechmeria coniospora]